MRSRLYTRTGLHRFLASLEDSDKDCVTVYITPASFPDFIESLRLGIKYDTQAADIREAARTETVIHSAKKYGTGAAIFWSGTGKQFVLPAFPIIKNEVFEGKFDASALHRVLDRKYSIGVVMVTWGWYALGIFDGSNLVECKIGTGHIHKKHKKGGSSQKRFARRTEEQRKDFLCRVSNRIEERFGGYLPDYIFFGGNRLILKPLIQETRYLQTRIDKISPRILNVRYANREALAGSLAEINRSLVFTF
jgi:Actinobacteria/chloroflexi VLRF1 release factor